MFAWGISLWAVIEGECRDVYTMEFGTTFKFHQVSVIADFFLASLLMWNEICVCKDITEVDYTIFPLVVSKPVLRSATRCVDKNAGSLDQIPLMKQDETPIPRELAEKMFSSSPAQAHLGLKLP